MKHPTESEIIDHLTCAVEEIEKHAGNCRLCARILGEYQQLGEALRDDLSWFSRHRKIEHESPEVAVPRPMPRIRRIERSGIRVMGDVPPVPLSTIRGLLSRSHALMEADPNEALAIASKALGLCAKADAGADDLAYARGSAQKERANALRYLGRYLEALAKVEKLKPDVLTMDVEMPHLNGIDATLALRAQFPRTAVVVLSMHDDSETQSRALAAGAAAFVAKHSMDLALLEAIRRVAHESEGVP